MRFCFQLHSFKSLQDFGVISIQFHIIKVQYNFHFCHCTMCAPQHYIEPTHQSVIISPDFRTAKCCLVGINGNYVLPGTKRMRYTNWLERSQLHFWHESYIHRHIFRHMPQNCENRLLTLSVCPSIHPLFGCQWQHIYEIWYLKIFRKSVAKMNFY